MIQLNDYQKNYNPYYDLYLKNLYKKDNLTNRLKENLEEVYVFFNTIEDEKFSFAYAPEKWNIAQIFQHIIDTERIFCYRALKIAREPEPDIIAYDHEKYAENSSFQSKAILLEDYKNNRMASMSLFKTFSQKELSKSVNFSHYKFNVGLIPFIFCGHELHHIKVVKDKYLK